MRNIRLIIAYDGTDFHGWQRQPDLPTVQECLEAAIQKLVGMPVELWGSGRTDAGTHASRQVANFKSASPIPCASLLKALNDLLPPTVRVRDAREVADGFHARYDARSKTYRYRVLQSPVCPPFIWRFVCHHPYPLDHRSMAEAAKFVEGEHDFTSFAASPAHAAEGDAEARNDDARSPVRTMTRTMTRTIFSSRLVWRPRTSMLIYEVRGSGFLHHMVRNIVGTLLEVGRGKLAPRDLLRILEARDRTQAGPTAPARGLCLVKVEY
jgi:tRNA pseudouridine38-40 synthase